MKRVILFIVITLIVIGCKKPKPNVDPAIYYVGDTITLKYRECKEIIDTVANESYKLCLDSICEGRVPLEICPYFYGLSYATISLRWMGSKTDNIKLKVYGCCIECGGECIDTLGYKFCSISLTPHPDTTSYLIPLKDYIAKLKIARP